MNAPAISNGIDAGFCFRHNTPVGQISKKNLKSKDGLNLYYETYGERNDRPVLFFLHGIGGDLDAWQFVRDELLGKGFSAVAMDIRGHGYSNHPRGFLSYKIDNLVEDVVSVMEAEKIPKIVLIGHCYGAVVALNFAVKYPEKLEKLVIISGTYRPPLYIFGKVVKVLAVGIGNLGALISPKPHKPQHSKYPAGKFHRDYEWIGLAKTILHNSLRSYLLTSKEVVNLELEPFLGRIKTPTLVIVGEKDTIFPMSISKKIHEKIPESKFEVIKWANHVVILNNPDKVSKLIFDFLKTVS